MSRPAVLCCFLCCAPLCAQLELRRISTGRLTEPLPNVRVAAVEPFARGRILDQRLLGFEGPVAPIGPRELRVLIQDTIASRTWTRPGVSLRVTSHSVDVVHEPIVTRRVASLVRELRREIAAPVRLGVAIFDRRAAGVASGLTRLDGARAAELERRLATGNGVAEYQALELVTPCAVHVGSSVRRSIVANVFFEISDVPAWDPHVVPLELETGLRFAVMRLPDGRIALFGSLTSWRVTDVRTIDVQECRIDGATAITAQSAFSIALDPAGGFVLVPGFERTPGLAVFVGLDAGPAPAMGEGAIDAVPTYALQSTLMTQLVAWNDDPRSIEPCYQPSDPPGASDLLCLDPSADARLTASGIVLIGSDPSR